MSYRISESIDDTSGLGWFAQRDLHPGEFLLKEEASVVAPADHNTCVECLSVIVGRNQSDDCPGGCGQVMCQKCQASAQVRLFE